MKKAMIVIWIVLFSFPIYPVYGEENSFDVLDREVKRELGTEISMKEIIEGFQKGEVAETIGSTLKKIGGRAIQGTEIRQDLISLLMIGFVMALFSNFSDVFSQPYMGHTGAYGSYIVLCTLFLRQFLSAYEIVTKGLENVVVFMKLMIPTYSMVLMTVSGLTTSMASYEFLFLLIGVVEWGVLHIILPCIKCTFVLKMLNFLLREDMFSSLIDVLEQLIAWALKGAIMIVVLFNVFQSMLLPAIDSVKSNVIQKGINFLPGMGQVIGMVANTAIGSGIILKNAIGVAGMLIICIVLFVPFLKLFAYIATVLIAKAVLQPMTEKNLLSVLEEIFKTGKLLVQCMATTGALFLLTLAILSLSTNLNYYVG